MEHSEKTKSSKISDIIVDADSDLSALEESEDELSPQDIEAQSSDMSDDDVTSSSQTGVWRPAGRQPAADAFLGRRGPTAAAHVSNAESPLDYFLLFYPDNVLGKVVLETNRNAAQFLAANPPTPHAISKEKRWTDVSEEEVRKFIGLIMMMGFVQKNGNLMSYWSKDERLATPYFPAVMSRNRFQKIKRFIHFSNNDELPNNVDDKLYKIQPVCNLILERWRSMYDLGEQISVDEGIMKWRRRLDFRVHQKDERKKKHDIKTYILFDAKSKYCWNIDIHHGVSKTLKETVIALLTPKCLSVWHSLYMDKAYNSVALSEFLLERKVHTVGTLRRNRGEPLEIRDPGLM